MTSTTVHRRRGLGARLVPFIIALGALPLMAPTCGASGEGVRVFSRRSLIIPMDVCYQYMTDGVKSSYTPAGGTTECPATDSGDVIKAYGLVYQLIRNGVAVYWVIDNNKTAVDGVDFSVQYDGGFPVLLYDWTTGVEGAAPRLGANNGHTVNYRGGPFVVDGSDFARASAVLQSFKTTFGNVNVHVSNVAFRGYSKRTMAGGWNAGGNTPPKLALLDIGSTISGGAKNSEVVIQGYLARAGLDTPGASGTTAPGTHGEIYDRLFMPDFIPTVAGDWTRTALAKNGYQILWVPHWAAPGSCSDCPPSTSCTCANRYPVSDIAASLQTIGSFVSQVNPVTGGRGDLFAECAGLGSFEGVFSSTDPSNSSYNTGYVLSTETATGGEPTTHFETESSTTGQKPGVWIHTATSANPAAGYNLAYANSPLMQIGDYPFIPRSGAITNFKPNRYKGETTTLISEASAPGYDIFTLVPSAPSHGTIVYLGGHTYSGSDGAFEVAGARLVLNTLFNLGSSCQGGGACATGLPGVCATGHYKCLGGPDPTCVADIQPGQLVETCNGLDDNCNGEVDENLQTDCYQPPPGYVDPDGRSSTEFALTRNQGVCRAGISVCQRNPDGSYGMSACTGQVLPAPESCNGLDDDCNGLVDDGIASRPCYDGPDATRNVGACKPGSQVCQDGLWGGPAGVSFVPNACAGEVLPRPEVCGDAGLPGGAQDDDCDGVVNNGCTCTAGQRQRCFSGPGTAGQGVCHAGWQTCQTGGFWGECPVDPANPDAQLVATIERCVPPDVYDPVFGASIVDPSVLTTWDVNCDGRFTRCPDCSAGEARPCPDSVLPPLPPGSSWDLPFPSQCRRGTQTCTADGTWGACTGTVLPSEDADGPMEKCDGLDNNCNGVVDEFAHCPVGDACIRGVCVPKYCGSEQAPPDGYACSAGVDADGLHTVITSSCGDTHPNGCDVGQLCTYGNCVEPCPTATVVDPTTLQTTTVSLVCGTGTQCGGGACIAGSCYDQPCGGTDLCIKGICKPDPCANKLCPSGTFCRQGDCVQACTFVSCASGQKCGQDGFCEPDPCASKLCGAGQVCTAGVCAADPCLGKGCADGQVCVAQGTTPVCVDDLCNGVVCPAGACAGGQCFRSGNLTSAGTGRIQTTTSGGGCGCGSGSGVALPGLLALLAAPLARRRRRLAPGGRGALLLALAAVVLSGTACKSKKTETHFDPSTCANTCEGEDRCVDIFSDPSHCGATKALACTHACDAGQQCVEGVCGPSSLVAPFIRAISPTSGVKDDPALHVTLAGDRIQRNADLRITTGTTRSVPCPETPGGACQWVNGSLALTLDLTGASPSAPWQLRVVNPDGVISNAFSLGIVVPTPSLTGVVAVPQGSAGPNSVPAGSAAKLVVSGSGFTDGSRCHLSPVPGIGDLALVTTVSGAGVQLDCALDATGIPPGVYTLTVVSEPDGSGATHVSNPLSVTVTPSDPVITSIDPSSATVSPATFLINGARFDLKTARVLIYVGGVENVLDPANVTTRSDSAILVHDLPIKNATFPDGVHSVKVRNGTSSFAYSNGVSFVVGSVAAPALSAFSPSTAYQGDPAVQLTFTGANLPSGSRIELEPAGATSFTRSFAATMAPPSCTSDCTSAQATLSLVNEVEGQWLARLRFGAAASAPTSAPWPLRVLSNQAILRDYRASPDPAQAGTAGGHKDGFTFSVSNLHGPFDQVRIVLVDPTGLPTVTFVPSPVPDLATTTLVVPGPNALSLLGAGTGTYTFGVQNPNATRSNTLPFAVNPGIPTLSSPVCVAGTSGPSCTRWAVQGPAATIRLTGANFAKPDVSGNGSMVYATANLGLPSHVPPVAADFPTPDPCDALTTTHFQPVPGTVTVVSPTQIDVQVDTLSAFADPEWGTTYYIGVWNPGGPTGLQKSSCGVDPRTLPWFRLCAKATGTSCTQ